MLEVVKLTALLHTIGTREYRDWLEPRAVLRMAAEGGYKSVAMGGRAGVLEAGAEADLCLCGPPPAPLPCAPPQPSHARLARALQGRASEAPPPRLCFLAPAPVGRGRGRGRPRVCKAGR